MNWRKLAVTAGVLLLLAWLGWRIWHVGLGVNVRGEAISGSPADCVGEVRFAVIGDFGDSGAAEASVAALVDSWAVDFVVTVGDNNYNDGEASTIDDNIGQYYHEYIYPYVGAYGPGASEMRFFPALGNHDWKSGSVSAHTDYFSLPGNERYYDFVRGPVHFFVLDSDQHEPDGRTQDSAQARWLEEAMGAAEAPWRLVVMHHPPYSSMLWREDIEVMQWPFAEWGATAILAGHNHFYERLTVDGLIQFVNGIGGRNPIHRFGAAHAGSQVRFNQEHGAMLIVADRDCLNFSAYGISGELIDSFTLPGEAVDG